MQTMGTTGRPLHVEVVRLFEEFRARAIDRTAVPQEQLDLAEKSRVSLLPWRGQFSPELVNLLIRQNLPGEARVLDPFVGSGTTLFECVRLGLNAVGSEINPSAYHLARLAELCKHDVGSRLGIIRRTDTLIDTLGIRLPDNPPKGQAAEAPVLDLARMKSILTTADPADPGLMLVVAALMLAMGDADELSAGAFVGAYRKVRALLSVLPNGEAECRVNLADARRTGLERGSIGLIVTSPPYINVFNYHQNYRPAMEILGWDLLRVAESEIGSNRKHRGNRFLTVVQYCLDMAMALGEFRRVLRDKGRAVLVVGRTSNVRGVGFPNGQLLYALAVGAAGFQLCLRQERKYTNRFGRVIFEDILTMAPTAGLPRTNPAEFAREVACCLLDESLTKAEGEALDDLRVALRECTLVPPSPMLSPQRVRVT